MKRIGILILVLLINIVTVVAQKQDREFFIKPKNEVENSKCELSIKELSLLSQNTKPDSLMIIISHSGKDEKIIFGKRRLYNAKALFTKAESKNIRPSESVMVAEGERISNQGYLDFYVQGALELRITFKKNRDLYIRPCSLNFPDEKYCSTELEKLFYPCKK